MTSLFWNGGEVAIWAKWDSFKNLLIHVPLLVHVLYIAVEDCTISRDEEIHHSSEVWAASCTRIASRCKMYVQLICINKLLRLVYTYVHCNIFYRGLECLCLCVLTFIAFIKCGCCSTDWNESWQQLLYSYIGSFHDHMHAHLQAYRLPLINSAHIHNHAYAYNYKIIYYKFTNLLTSPAYAYTPGRRGYSCWMLHSYMALLVHVAIGIWISFNYCSIQWI